MDHGDFLDLGICIEYTYLSRSHPETYEALENPPFFFGGFPHPPAAHPFKAPHIEWISSPLSRETSKGDTQVAVKDVRFLSEKVYVERLPLRWTTVGVYIYILTKQE